MEIKQANPNHYHKNETEPVESNPCRNCGIKDYEISILKSEVEALKLTLNYTGYEIPYLESEVKYLEKMKGALERLVVWSLSGFVIMLIVSGLLVWSILN